MLKREVKLDKPNQLISIKPQKEISLLQQKCINLLFKTAQDIIAKKDKEIVKDKRYIYYLSCKELKERAGVEKKDYNYIEEELRKLTEIRVDVVAKDNKDNWATFSLLERIERIGDKFEFSLDWLIVKALKEYDFYTKLDLLQIANLKSKYSVILYEMAVRYKDFMPDKMSLEELRERTGTTDKYASYSNFRRRVLDPACEEVSEKTNIDLSYEPIKTGRKITHLSFEVKVKEKIPELINYDQQLDSAWNRQANEAIKSIVK